MKWNVNNIEQNSAPIQFTFLNFLFEGINVITSNQIIDCISNKGKEWLLINKT